MRLLEALVVVSCSASVSWVVLGCSLPRDAVAIHPHGDAGGGLQDAFVPADDAFVPGDDAFTPGDDAFVPPVDAFVPGVDAFVPPNDAFVPPNDAFVPPDMGPTCTPGSVCTADGASVLTCASGVLTMTHCDRGCAAGVCRPQLDCALTIAGSIATSGTTRWDVCGGGNDNNDNHTAPNCPNFGPDGEDVMLRLDVDRASTVSIGASDVADGTLVDPVLYLRTICGTRSSELACDDDGGTRSFDSQLDPIVLSAGEYFLVVDTFDGSGSGPGSSCGAIDVSVTMTPL